MAKIDIDLPMKVGEFKALAKSDPVEAGQQLETELRAFDNHLMRNRIEPMGRFERQMVREFIGYKLVHAPDEGEQEPT